MVRQVRLNALAGLFGVVLVLASLVGAASVFAAGPQQDVQDANGIVQQSLSAARSGDLAAARQAYDQYRATWSQIEDGVKDANPDAYRDIETAMRSVRGAFNKQPIDQAEVVTNLVALDREQQEFIGAAGSARALENEERGTATVAGLLDVLAQARTALTNNDYPTAAARLNTFQTNWLDVEGEVKTRSASDYRDTEDDMALAATLASQSSPRALEVVNRMATRLEPYREAQQYGVFDATIILLREGLEALLVMVALSAFLTRSGNRAGQRWLWTGAIVGLLASVGLGLAIQAFFGAIVNPGNRELMEGVVGLVAATMLIYVSYWLHSKANLGGWQAYINQRTRQAVFGGQLFGLAALAFLAVFREGAETALFYLGMAANISNADLLLGLGIGFALLAAIGFLLIVVGVRIPLRPFFTVASVLVFYLCFKFVGTGIHSLQVAGVVPAGSSNLLASIDVIGVYPTWPTTIAQMLLLALAVGVVLAPRLKLNSLPLTRLVAGLF